MTSANQDLTKAQRDAKADDLMDKIMVHIAAFEEAFTHSTPETEAWAFRVNAMVHGHLDKLRQQLHARPTDLPRSDERTPKRPTQPARIEVDERAPLSAAEQAHKERDWLDMWGEIKNLIAAFEAEFADATGDVLRWVVSTTTQVRAYVAKTMDELVREHPEMPIVAGLTMRN